MTRQGITERNFNQIVMTLVGCAMLMASWMWLSNHPKGSYAKHQSIGTQVELNERYDENNRLWFNDELPKDTLVKFTYPGKDTVGLTKRSGTGYEIIINPVYNVAPVVQHATLFHEQCHVATFDEFDEHGPRWLACMHRLAKIGALDNVW